MEITKEQKKDLNIKSIGLYEMEINGRFNIADFTKYPNGDIEIRISDGGEDYNYFILTKQQKDFLINWLKQ